MIELLVQFPIQLHNATLPHSMAWLQRLNQEEGSSLRLSSPDSQPLTREPT